MSGTVGSVTLDGALSDWTPSDRIDTGNAVADYEVYGKVEADSYVFAIKASAVDQNGDAITIGNNTTIWLNTDQDSSTGYQIWGSAGGVEYKVELSGSTLTLYSVAADASGNEVATLIQTLDFGLSGDGTTIEFAVPKTAIGSPAALNALIDVNNATFLPGSYNNSFTIVDTADLPVDAGTTTKVAIVYSETTAANYFGLTGDAAETAYTQLFLAAQNQAAMAGIPFDVITEADLKDLSKLVNYDAIVFPSFENVNSADVTAITNTLTLLAENYDVSLIAAGNFMTNDETGAALPDAYARMAQFFDLAPEAFGFTGTTEVTVSSAGTGFDGVGGYTAGEVINTYANSAGVGWQAFTDATPGTTTHSVIATQTVTGTGAGTYDAIVTSTVNGDRNVHFSTTALLGDNNQLSQAIQYAVEGASGPTVGLQLTRQDSIFASRTDMDQSQFAAQVNPTDGSAGIYDKLIPIVESWKAAYNFVSSYYINIGDNQGESGYTDWTISLPYYQQLLALGGEIGSHSLTHLLNLDPAEDTRILTDGTGPGTFEYEFGQSRDAILQHLTTLTSIGAAVPGATEYASTAEQILQYYSYLSGGYSSNGAGYPGAFGYLSAADAEAGKVYLAPNMKFDFTLVGYQHYTPEAALAEWMSEFNSLTSHAEAAVIVWPWHDYGPTNWENGGYTEEMFTQFIEYVYNSGAEFVTLADLANRIKTFEQSSIAYSVSGDTITATVTSADAGKFALDLDNLSGKVIASVTGWYAYDSDSVFTPTLGGATATYTINLGTAAADVTHITALPMRADLASVVGDGVNLSFSLVGEGKLTVDLGGTAGRTLSVSGATVVSQTGDILVLDVGANGTHTVNIIQDAAPTITSLGGGDTGAASIAENGTVVAALVATDADLGLALNPQTLTFSIVGGEDAGLFAIDNGNLVFKSAPDYEALPADAGLTPGYQVTVQVSDGKGFVDTQAITVNVTDVNDVAPTITTAATQSVAENTTIVAALTSTDIDTVGTNPATFSITGGADAALFEIVGGNLVFRTAPDYETGPHSYEVQLTATDGTNTTVQTISVAVTDVNEAPVITMAATQSVAENTSVVAALAATDPDQGQTLTFALAGGEDADLFDILDGNLVFKAAPNFEALPAAGITPGYQVTVQVSDGQGGTDTQDITVNVTDVNEAPTLTMAETQSVAENTTVVAALAATDPDQGQTLTFALAGGEDADLFDILDGNLVFKSAPNFEALPAAGTTPGYQVAVQVSDGQGGTDTRTITVNVTDVNEAPTLTMAETQSVAENTSVVAALAATDPDQGQTLTFAIAGGEDADLFDIVDGNLAFKTAPNYEALPGAGTAPGYQVTVQVSDGQGGTDTRTITVNVTDVNEAPTLTMAETQSVAENTSVVAALAATDPDQGQTLTFAIAGGEDADLFDIVDGNLAFKTAPNYEALPGAGTAPGYQVTVQVSDGQGGTDTRTITVDVTDVNEAPVITMAETQSVAENTSVVAALAATDPDQGQTLSFSIAGGEDADLFDIVDGNLVFKAAPNFEALPAAGTTPGYQVTVQVSDGQGGTDTQDITVGVTDLNDVAPTITTAAAQSVAENTTFVAALASTDPDTVGTNPATLSITGGTDADLFQIVGGNLVFKTAPNYETDPHSYEVQVTADDGVNTTSQTITVALTDVNELPTLTTAAAQSVAENTTVVAALAATDPDQGQTLTFALAGGEDADLFQIVDGNLAFKSAPNFEALPGAGTTPGYQVTVQVSDGQGGTDTQDITVGVTDLNDVAPTITTAAAQSVAENRTLVAALTSTDPDTVGTNPATLSITGGADADLFEIVDGKLAFKTAPDFEIDPHSYVVEVTANDGVNTTTKTITVALIDINDNAPVIGPNDPSGDLVVDVAENSTVVATLLASDADTVDDTPATFSINGGADAALFDIVDGSLVFKTAPDYETPTDADHDNVYVVEVSASDGVNASVRTLAVSVTNVVGVTINGTSSANVINGKTPVAGQPMPTDEEDKINGGSGNDSIFGLGGDDILNGGAGADTMIGGTGSDIYMVDSAKDVVDETGGDGTDLVQSSVTFSLADAVHAIGDIENLTLTGKAKINGTGNALDNEITGNIGNNVLAGLGGADRLDGGLGIDTASYAASMVGVNVSLMNGTASGGDAEGDTLVGIEYLTGSAFDDTLEGDAGNNYLVGGLGTDTVSYAHATAGVTVTLASTKSQNTIGAGRDTLSGFENVTGSEFDDKLTGSKVANVLTGGGGADTLNGWVGADTMIGGTGNDIYVVDNAGDVVDETGGDGTDLVQSSVAFSLSDGAHAIGDIENLTLTGKASVSGTGNALANIIIGNAGANVLTGLGGDDILNGGAGADTMIGGTGSDIYMVDSAKDVVDETGGDGTDLVQSSVTFSLADAVHAIGDIENLTLTGKAKINGTGNALDNEITGNIGNNVLAGLGGADRLDGGLGIDTASYAASMVGVNVSLMSGTASGGDAEGDTLVGIEYLTGSAFDDTLEGDAGNNYLVGGLGTDTVSYAHATAGVTVTLASTKSQNTIGAGRDTLSGFENVTGSEFDDKLTGSKVANVLTGGGGADTLNGWVGADTMIGGTGDDIYVVDNAGDVVDETGGDGTDLVQSSVAFSLSDGAHAIGDIENLTLTGKASVSGTGNALANIIIGNAGANVLTGLGGDDILNGGAGADTMIGGTGSDIYMVDSAKDVVDETGGDGTDLVQSSVTFSLADAVHAIGDIENLTLTGKASINGTGNALDNEITGNTGNNVLAGLGGADHLDGGLGTDTASYAASSAGVNVSLMNGTASGGDAEGDTLVGIEYLTGSAFDDTLEGDAGNNYLVGGLGTDTVSYAHATAGVTVTLASTKSQNTIGAGRDTLSGFENVTGSDYADTLIGSKGDNVIAGGVGADKLTGGAGADTFVFNFMSEGGDTITDFVSGIDRFQISADGFGGDLVAGATATLVTVAEFASATNAGTGGYFIFDNFGDDAGTIYWDQTGEDGSDAVAIAKISATGLLVPSDFHIV